MTKITPTALGQRGADMDATGVYDWEKQRYQYDVCKFGTYQTTRSGTSSYAPGMSFPSPDDNNMDNYTD
jgi:hypothetical protein